MKIFNFAFTWNIEIDCVVPEPAQIDMVVLCENMRYIHVEICPPIFVSNEAANLVSCCIDAKCSQNDFAHSKFTFGKRKRRVYQ